MSVRKLKKGSWIVDFCYQDNSGKEKRFRKQGFKNRKEAKEFEADKVLKIEKELLAELELKKNSKEENESGESDNIKREEKYSSENKDSSEENKSEPEDKDILLKDYLENWLATYVTKENSPAELIRKTHLVNIQIVPYLRNKKLTELKPSDGKKLKEELMELNLSYRTINYALGVLKKALNCAVIDELIPKNPLSLIPRLTVIESDDKWDWLKPEESEAFLDVILKDYPQWYAYFIILLHTGIRIGELCGLFWEDVDLKEGFIKIRHSLVLRNYGPPKSKKEREIPLTATAIEVLKEHQLKTRMLKPVKAVILGKVQRGRHVFVDQNGNPHKHLASSIKKPLCKALETAKIRTIRPHDLRHTCASQMRLRGIPIEDIQSLLGHSDIKMTLIYSHISPVKKRIAVDVLDLRQRKKSVTTCNKNEIIAS